MEKQELLRAIGNRIKTRRQELGFTQQDLASMVGYKSRSTINKIELGRNDIVQSSIQKIADALQTTPAYLMGWSDYPGYGGPVTSQQAADAPDDRSFYQQARGIFKDIPAEEQEALYQALLVWNNIFASYQTPGDLGSKKIKAAAYATGLIRDIDQAESAEIIDSLSQILLYLKMRVRERNAQALKHLLEKKTPTAEETKAACELFQAYCKAETPIKEIVDTALKPYRQEESFSEEIG